jgi:hypothetical protein
MYMKLFKKAKLSKSNRFKLLNGLKKEKISIQKEQLHSFVEV